MGSAIFAGIVIVTLLGLACALAFALFYGVDYVLGDTREGECRVSKVFFKAQHTQVNFGPDRKIRPFKVVPDHWQVDIMTPQGVDDFVVGSEPNFYVDQKVWARYRVGGITRTAIVIFEVKALAA